EQRRLLHLDLLAEDAAAIDAAAHHPIDAAMAVIGSAVAILAEGAAELGDHHDDRVAPCRGPDLLGEAGEPSPKLAETVGEIAIGGALIDMRIPAADIDKAEIELLAHQAADAPGRQFETARRHRAAIGRSHLLRERAIDIVAHLEPLGDGGGKI